MGLGGKYTVGLHKEYQPFFSHSKESFNSKNKAVKWMRDCRERLIRSGEGNYLILALSESSKIIGIHDLILELRCGGANVPSRLCLTEGSI